MKFQNFRLSNKFSCLASIMSKNFIVVFDKLNPLVFLLQYNVKINFLFYFSNSSFENKYLKKEKIIYLLL